MTAEDIARDLEAEGLATAVHNALVSAARQGASYTRGKVDALVDRYDSAYAEWRITAAEYGELSDAAQKAYRSYVVLCYEITPKLIDVVRSEGT